MIGELALGAYSAETVAKYKSGWPRHPGVYVIIGVVGKGHKEAVLESRADVNDMIRQLQQCANELWGKGA